MKKSVSLIILLSLTFSLSAFSEKYFVNDDDVNLRGSAELRADNKICKLNKGTEVNIHGETAECRIGKSSYPWYLISVDSIKTPSGGLLRGWIYGEYVSSSSGQTPSAPGQILPVIFSVRDFYAKTLIEKNKDDFADAEGLLISTDTITDVKEADLWYVKERLPEMGNIKTAYGYAQIFFNRSTRIYDVISRNFTDSSKCSLIGKSKDELFKTLGTDGYYIRDHYSYDCYELSNYSISIYFTGNTVSRVSVSRNYS